MKRYIYLGQLGLDVATIHNISVACACWHQAPTKSNAASQ